MKPSIFIALILGFLFAIGLGLGGMTQPSKVKGFLDFFGQWDPSLMFVMGGAVGVYALFFRFVRPRLAHPWLAPRFQIPTRNDLDLRLFAGAAIFGVGWGIGGICPGPAITSLTTVVPDILIFLVAMGLGMAIASRTPFSSMRE